MSNHTPGPWTINDWPQDTSDIRIGAVGTPRIASIHLRDVSINEQKANAQLIARSPEMFAALKVTLDALNRIPNHKLDISYEYGEIKDSYFLAHLLGRLLREIES